MGSKITFGRAMHRGEDRITLRFDYDKSVIAEIRKIPGSKWSKSLGCWHVPENANLVYLKSNHPVSSDDLTPNRNNGVIDKNEMAVQTMERWMLQRSYSHKTIELYSRHVCQLFIWADRPWDELVTQDVDRYNYDTFVRRDKTHRHSAHNIFVSALKLFYKSNGRDHIVAQTIVRPRRQKRLPIVLSEQEVRRLFQSTGNIKHRVLLMLIYSAGLRIGETLRLKLIDINGERRVIEIHQGKGKRDRQVPLSQKVLELLREYYRIYRPTVYLFEGEKEGRPYSSKSAQNVIKKSVRRAGIKKRVTLHTLRHSYATHLMERGVGLRYIQEILGHSSPKTTMIYTHVSGKRLRDVVSPLDEMDI